MAKFSAKAMTHIPLVREVATGNPLRPHEAVHLPPKGTYVCLDPNCHGDVTVYERPKYSGRYYFRHRNKEASGNCGFHRRHDRTIRRHDAAQHLLAAVLREALDKRGPMPLWLFQTAGQTLRALPLIIADTVKTEWTCPKTGRRADIALLDRSGAPVLIVEVFHTHAVDRNKRRDLSDYWWIEVEANAVIADFEQLPIRHSGNMPFLFSPETQQVPLMGMRKREW